MKSSHVLIPAVLLAFSAYGLRGLTLMLLTTLSYLIYISLMKNYKFDFMLICLLLFFLLSLSVSIFWSNNMQLGLRKAAYFSLWSSVFLLFKDSIYKYFKVYLKFSIIVFSVYLAMIWLMEGSPLNLLSNTNIFYRLDSAGLMTNTNPIWQSRFLGYNIILLFFIPFYNISNGLKNNWLMILLIIFLIISSIIYMLLFNSRGPIIALLITLFCFIYYGGKINNSSKNRFRSLSLFFIAIMIFAVYLVISNYTLDFLRLSIANNASSMERINLINLAIDDFNISSIFFGKGAGNFSYIHNIYSTPAHPHNIFIEILYENGIFGLSIFIILIYSAFKSFHKNLTIERFYFFLGFVYFVINAQFSGDILSNINLFIFFIMTFEANNYFNNKGDALSNQAS